MKLSKRMLSIALCLIMLFGMVAIGGDAVIDLFVSKASAADYKTGEIIEFGSYPQSKVTDEATIAVLTASEAATSATGNGWISYNYYIGTGSYSYGKMTASDYMRYIDVTSNGNKYRGVTFSQYRPYLTLHQSNASTSYQDDNGFNVDTVYWFKYEPLKWRILDASTGLVMCETIIDSQPYNNYIISKGADRHGNTAYWGNSSQTCYASDYANSSIRKWLTEDFYTTAFSSTQQSKIKTTTLNNDGYYTLTGITGYEEFDSASTNDKIFLLSYDEVINSNYGFSSSRSGNDSARQAKGSDYAKCQGLHESSYDGCSYWRLRSPGDSSSSTCNVSDDGGVDGRSYIFYYSYDTGNGVRPALRLNLPSDNKKLKVPVNTEVEYAATVTVKAKATDIPEGYYVALYDGNNLLKKGSNTEVSYAFPGEFTETKNITVKIIDDKENVQKDGNGKDLTASFEIKAKSGFFAKLMAFFKRLFKALPAVTVEP